MSWDRSSITFVGGIIGQSQQISATAAMVVAGKPGDPPVIPITTSTSSTSTTSTSTTSTTVVPSTSSTLLGCTVAAATVTPAANARQGNSGHLSFNFNVSVTTIGSCPSGVRVRLMPTEGPTTLAMAGGGTAFTLGVDRNAYNWAIGTQTVTILNGATGTVIGNTSFTVVL